MEKTTCKERIQERMESRMEDIDAYINEEDDTKRDELFEDLNNNVLSVDTEKVYNILLSTGGPEDGYKIVVNSNEEYLYGVYYFKDWFDGAERDLTDEEAQKICDVYGLYEVRF